jgi:glycosyltransferase involved in cell wall biosynthesis
MMPRQPLNIVSITRLLPTPNNPAQGIFVKRRLDGMRNYAMQQSLQVIPFFPLVKPLPDWCRNTLDSNVTYVPMFYLPGAMKSLDAHWMYRAILPVIKKMHRESSIDMIDAHWGYPEAVACQKVSQTLDIPFCVTLRGHEIDYLANSHFRPILLEAFRKANLCICVSQSLADLLEAHGIDPQKTKVVRNVVDRNTFYIGNKNKERESLGISSEYDVILSVGQLLPGKRHIDFLHAIAKALEVRPSIRAFIAGSKDASPRHTQEIVETINRLGLTNRVKLLGTLSAQTLASYYRAADVFCLLTEREGCCNAVLEALASGLPIVTTPAGDNAFFLDEGVNGYLVAYNSASEASERILQLLESRLDPQKISQSIGDSNWDDTGRIVVNLIADTL